MLSRVGKQPCTEGQRFLGLVVDSRVLGGVMFDEFTDASCEMHVALTPNAPIRRLIVAAFRLPFCEWGVQKVFGRVRGSNRAALKFDLRLGFTPEAELKNAYAGGESMFVLSMEKADCRWIR